MRTYRPIWRWINVFIFTRKCSLSPVDQGELCFGFVTTGWREVEEVPSGGKLVARIACDDDELRGREPLFQAGVQEDVFGVSPWKEDFPLPLWAWAAKRTKVRGGVPRGGPRP